MSRRLLSATLGVVIACAAAGAQTYEVVHRAPGTGSFSAPLYGRLLASPDGSFYGTTAAGGEFAYGSISKLTPDGQGGYTRSDVYSFTAQDGSWPYGSLVRGPDGSLYGVTFYGGAAGAGVLFRLDPRGRLTVLHDFANGPGQHPSPVVFGPNGSLYGTTGSAGLYGQGTLYRYDFPGGLTTLHDFGNGGDGAHPGGAVMVASDGSVWGATQAGGAYDDGTIFRLSGSGYAIVHDFTGSAADGFTPNPTLVEARGFVYGTTVAGVAAFPVFGTLFRIDGAGTLTTLHVFDTSTGGAPYDGFATGTDGNLFGVTNEGFDPPPPGGSPQNQYNPVFYIVDTTLPAFGVRHIFPPGSSRPYFAPVAAADGNLYGMDLLLEVPGPNLLQYQLDGTITSVFQTPAGYGLAGASILSALYEDTDGSLYGTNTVRAFLKVDPEGYQSLFHDMDYGVAYSSGLIKGTDGNFYATLDAAVGDPGQFGRFVRFDASGDPTTLYDFTPLDVGQSPSRVTQGSDGEFYGVASSAGANGWGSLFRLTADGGVEVLHSFDGSDDGWLPLGPLVLASDGNFYGVTQNGGTNFGGTLFRYEPGVGVTTIHQFVQDGPEGSGPQGSLIQAPDGDLYGTTAYGGANAWGTIFRADLAGNVTKLYDSGSELGLIPGVVMRADGFLYAANQFEIFKLDSHGAATPVHDFPQGEQCNFAPFLLGANGDLLGTTEESSTAGSVFRITDAAAPPQLAALDPASGPAEGGASVRIQGRHFRSDVTATFGGEAPAALGVQRESLLTVIAPALPPGTLNDVVVDEASDSPGPVTLAGAWFSDFLDVPGTHLFHDDVESVFRLGITAGCGSGNYCPSAAVTRAQMAVFLLKAEHGSAYAPPACTGTFGDVPCPSTFADWIEQLAEEGITAGCGGGDYCPDSPVTRAQMAVFLLKTEHGSGYAPPACAGVFGDVPCPSLFADWIEQLAADGITAGCGGGNFCPDSPNTRGQMATFLVRTFFAP